jgi:filamentous hemagglutinin
MATDANAQKNGFADKQGGTGSNGSLIKIGTELANTRSKSTSDYASQTAKQSTLNAGTTLSIIANGSAAGNDGDLHVIGSSIKAANTSLLASNDILLESAQNTADWSNRNSNNKTAIGASFNIGQQNGFTLDLGAQLAKGMGNGSSVTQVNTTVDTGSLLLRSGGDTTLAGAQVRADEINALIDGNLNIISRQDTQDQKSKQSSGGFGASICIPPFCYGTPVAASANLAAGNMNSEYKGVTDQTGLFAGTGGYTVDVGKTTTLEGGVIASDASANKNLLITDRLIARDIKNVSEIEAQSAGISISGSYGGAGASASVGGLYGIALSESDKSHTRSAVSEGTIIVRNPEGAQDTVGLNRDTKNANELLDKPDEEAMNERIELVKSSVELAKGIGDAVAAAKIKEAQNPESEASKVAIRKLRDQGIFNPTGEQVAQQVQRDYGMGSSFQKASQAIASIVQGVLGGNITGALSGAAAPYIAQEIRDATEGDPTANLMAHAVLGALVARASGNSALAGAVGAVAAEEAARIIKEELYGGVSNDQLTPEQKQTISSLATLVAGIGGASAGTSSLDAVTAALVGKNAVENNQLSFEDVNNFAQEIIKANKEGKTNEPIWEKYKALSAKQRAEMLASNCGASCSIYYQAEMDGGIVAADGLSSLTWFFDLSPEDAQRIRQFVTEENQGDMALLYNSLPAWEKVALVAKDTAEALGAGGLASRGKTSVAAVVGKNKGSPIPTAEPTVASNGLTYQSNPKHTYGQVGNRPNAGIEPKNSLELFGQSIVSPITYPNKVVTFAKDKDGNVHRFEGTNGVFHWNGSTGDAKNPLGANYVPTAVQKALGVRLK